MTELISNLLPDSPVELSTRQVNLSTFISYEAVKPFSQLLRPGSFHYLKLITRDVISLLTLTHSIRVASDVCFLFYFPSSIPLYFITRSSKENFFFPQDQS